MQVTITVEGGEGVSVAVVVAEVELIELDAEVIEEPKHCTGCGTKAEAGDRFCAECGWVIR